ncbi:16S rRNA (guanine(966)-N(2))-methyltransferase RsmD [Gammaproteobacteria bacterium]|nr:16S rRNA (guanine(966)-N(2))-methyltransferase RsmD [Gammaproteobacteria bacterium]
MNNKLKIISGKYKSRIITIPNKSNLKPTKAFIRESLFNIVNLKICDTSLDLFSGSGILSLEALSRGIKKATLVEQDLDLVKSIKKNLASLNETNAIVINKKVDKFLKHNISIIFDIIFLDPPYNTNLLDETLSYLKSYKYISHSKYIYFETSKQDKNDYLKYLSDTHGVLKDLSIGEVSYTIAINKNL